MRMKRTCHALILLSALFSAAMARAQSSGTLTAPSALPSITAADKELWRTTLKRTVMRPPCCGACKLFTMSDARALWGYLTGENPTARGKTLWEIHAAKLLAEFSRENPERYKQLYGRLKLPKEGSL